MTNSNNKNQYGLWETYNDFGVNTSTGYYNLKGQRTGEWSFGFSKNPKTTWSTKSYHKSIIHNYKNGKLNGQTKYFEFNGNKKTEAVYKEGTIIEQKEYNTNEEVINNYIEEYNSITINSGDEYNSMIQDLIKNQSKHKNTEGLILRNVDTEMDVFIVINNYFAKPFKKMVFNYCNINYIPKNFTKKFNYIEVLNINNNKLSELPESFGNLSNLKELALYQNKINKFPNSILKLVNLEFLSLSANDLTVLPENFDDLTKLEKLFLSFNKLTSLPKSIGNLTNLIELDLGYNKLTSIPESISNLTNLKILRLDKNKLISLPINIKNLKKLELLTLEKSQKKILKPYLKELKKNAPNLVIDFLK